MPRRRVFPIRVSATRPQDAAMSISPGFSAHWRLASPDIPPREVVSDGTAGDPSRKRARPRKAVRVDQAAETALDDAERKGFRFAVFGRSCAILAIGGVYLLHLPFPSGLYVFCGTISMALLGVIFLAAAGTRYERVTRFALFGFDTLSIAVLLAFVPLSSGGDVPQNLAFMTSRVQYYYILIAAAILTLSPALVIWTGVCSVIGLGAATGWIAWGMHEIVTFRDLMPAPSREAFLATVLHPNFFSPGFRFQEAMIIAAVTAIAAWAVHRARGVLRAHAEADAERQRIENLFGRYVPPSILSELIREGHLEPQMREATLLFIDIEGFTRISETMPPAKLVLMLNALFSTVTGVIDRNGGVVVNYIGDAVIASFNAPLPASEPAVQAIEAARRVLELVARRQFEGVSVRLRIGIATGPVSAGTVGSGRRQTYTLYGDAVNLAQRLETMNKDFGTQCLVCGATARLATTGRNQLHPMGVVPIRSRENPIEVFKLQ